MTTVLWRARFVREYNDMPIDHEKMKQLRHKRGWSAQELGDLAGLSGRQQILIIESGEGECLVSTLQKIARALGVPVEDILTPLEAVHAGQSQCEAKTG